MGIVMFWYYKSTAKPFKNAFLGSVSGLAALAAVNYLTTGLLTVNYLILACAAVVGIPGVAATILLNLFVK